MSAFSQAVNYTGKKPKSEGRPQIGRNQAYSAYSPPAKQGQAQPSYGSQQQQGGFPSVPQQGQQSAPDMSAYRQQAGFRYPSSPPPSMGTVAPPPAEGPVAVQDPSGVQRQIDDLKRRGTWDDPRNAAARQRMESQLRNINAAPPGYFITPDGRLEPNYISSFQGGQPPYLESDSVSTMYDQPRPSVESRYRLTPDGGFEHVSGPANRRLGPTNPVASPPQASPAPQQPAATPPTTNYMPQQSFSMPPMNFGTRDAFIASINNSLAQQQANGFNTQGAAPPQFNFPALYRQASQMVANGWSNPLAALLG